MARLDRNPEWMLAVNEALEDGFFAAGADQRDEADKLHLSRNKLRL